MSLHQVLVVSLHFTESALIPILQLGDALCLTGLHGQLLWPLVFSEGLQGLIEEVLQSLTLFGVG